MDPLAVLQRLGSGHLLDDLHEALTETAQDVVATGRPGRVTLTLTISTKRKDDPLVTVDESISRASPRAKSDPLGAIFWALDGALHREDPRQLPLDFRVVESHQETRAPESTREERVVE